MIRDYLMSLKSKGNFSWSDLSNLSGLPDATIRKVFSGETADPRFETVSRLVIAMGGSLDDIINDKKIQSEALEMNPIVSMKEVYEARIADIKETMAKENATLSRDKKYLAITCLILILILAGLLTIDLLIGSAGWIRY